ncbi:MAG: hypothetical protein H6659_17340 [Ardenticatenaceae bacterium]|nr:hypothetical protein [Ardenticatenaceae bacterium]
MKPKALPKNKYIYFVSILTLMLMWMVNTGCSVSEIDTTVNVTTTSPKVTATMNSESSTVVGITNTPGQTATPKPTTTSTATTTPIPTETATSSPTIVPTATRPTTQISDSKNYMVVGSKLWHPDNARMTEDIPVETGDFPWSPDGTQLVGIDNNGNISIFTLPTGELIELENVTASYSSAMWSPDGQNLLYLVSAIVDDNPAWQLAIYSLVNQTEILVTEPIMAYDYVSKVGWSSDSKKIAYIQWEPSITDAEARTVLKIIDVETGHLSQFSAPPPVSILGGSWSPIDDLILAYGYDTTLLGKPEGGSVFAYNTAYIIDLNFGTIEILLDSEGKNSESNYYDSRPLNLFISNTPWSPDGRSVIYSDQGVICSVALDTREETCLEETFETIVQSGSVGGEYPSWSPTGDLIGFILKFDSLFCSPIAVLQLENNEIKYTDADAGDCAVLWGAWSPKIE